MKTEIIDISDSTEDFYIGDYVQKGEDGSVHHVSNYGTIKEHYLWEAKNFHDLWIVMEVNKEQKTVKIVAYNDETTFKIEVIRCESCKHLEGSQHGYCNKIRLMNPATSEPENLFIEDSLNFGCIHYEKKEETI